MSRRLRLVFASATILATLACSEGSDGPLDPDDFDPIPESLPPNPAGVALPGDPDRPALDAVVDMPQSPAPASDQDGLYLLSRLEAWLAPDATIGEVNAALDAHEARILSMIDGVPLVTVVISRVADAEALLARAEALQESPAFLMVLPAMTTNAPLSHQAGGVAPSQERVTPANDSVPSHLEASRSPAAWNARSAALSVGVRVPVLVADYFSALTPHPEVSAMSFPPGVSGAVSASANHGWHVAGTIAADFGGNSAVGIHPEADMLLDVRAIPMGGLSWAGMMQEIVARMPASGNFVVSTSLGFGVDSLVHNVNGGNWTAQQLMTGIQQAIVWRLAVADRSDRFIHATAAGNERAYAGTMNRADLGSPWTMAHSFDDLRDALPAGLLTAAQRQTVDFLWAAVAAGNPAAAVRLNNTIIVGSSDAYGNESAFSNADPTVRATGESVVNVCRVAGDGCDGTYQTMSGTSMATPQVAGMTAWLWNLRPTWTATQVRDRVIQAYDSGLTDHYTMTLAADGGPSDAPVRRAILDVAGSSTSPGTNGLFDEHDIELYLQRFESYDIVRETDFSPDHSRYDLNGDGYTDAVNIAVGASVDLDYDRLTIGTASYVAGGQTISVHEAAPSDMEVLCYYAFSELFDGDDSARDELLSECFGTRPSGITLDSLSIVGDREHTVARASAYDDLVSNEWADGSCADTIPSTIFDPTTSHTLSLSCSASTARGRASASASITAGLTVTPEVGLDGGLESISWAGTGAATLSASVGTTNSRGVSAGSYAWTSFALRAVVTVQEPTTMTVSGDTEKAIVQLAVEKDGYERWSYDSRFDGGVADAEIELGLGTHVITVTFDQTIRTDRPFDEIVIVDEYANGGTNVTMVFGGGG